MKVTVSDLIEYLKTLPQDAELVTHNSLSWNFCDIDKNITNINDIRQYIKYIKTPTKNGMPINGEYVSIYDKKRIDY
jgi:hypothetical protein